VERNEGNTLRRIATGSLAWLSAIVLAWGAAGHASAEEMAGTDDGVASFTNARTSWQLKNLRLAAPGKVMAGEQGTLTRQSILEGDAESTTTGVPARARFRMAIDVFTPAQDMGKQKKGKYYVQGVWIIETDGTATSAGAGALTGSVEGRLSATLDFDPVADKRDWTANVHIPLTRVRSDGVRPGVRPVRGGGELAFAAGNAGTLSVDLKLWPKL
jgi:hypothetical protein